jgi:hypothetical protein
MLLFLLLNPIQPLAAAISSTYNLPLAWNSSPSPGTIGYIVYYGTLSGQYTNAVNVGNVTTNAVSGLTDGVTYFFAITSYDTNGLESFVSNEISYVQGLSTVGISATAMGQTVLTVNGPSGQSYEILAAQILPNWVLLGTVTVGAGDSASFTDTNASSFPTRFYCTQKTP